MLILKPKKQYLTLLFLKAIRDLMVKMVFRFQIMKLLRTKLGVQRKRVMRLQKLMLV